MTGMAALAILVMTESYKKNFKKLGKIVLSVALLGLAFGNWYVIVYYQEIYNATIAALQASSNLPDTIDAVLKSKPLWNVHGGQIMGGIIGLSLVWWVEVQTNIRTRLLNRVNKLRHAGKR
jgi:hypothetical protein